MDADQLTFTAVRKKRLFEDVARQVQKLIVDGSLKPGDRLPPERRQHFGIEVSGRVHFVGAEPVTHRRAHRRPSQQIHHRGGVDDDAISHRGRDEPAQLRQLCGRPISVVRPNSSES